MGWDGNYVIFGDANVGENIFKQRFTVKEKVQYPNETKDICQRLGIRDSSHPVEKDNYKANGQRSKVKNTP